VKKFYIKNRKILIVGGAGFIGHNLAIKLKKLGAKVSVLDALIVNNLYSVKKNENNLPFPKLALKILNQRFQLLKKNKIPVIKVDARDYFKLSNAINYIKPQVIIHLAAVSHANRSNKDPHSTFDHSLRTLENTLDNAKSNIEHFVFLSSSMVYGNFKKKEVKENDECNPIGIYGALKFSAEKIIKAYGQTFDLPYTIIRPSALYGERCISRRVGQIFIESALNKSKILINGDGEEKLDFTYIEDLMDGIICALKSKNSLQETFNITFGNSRPINRLLALIKENFDEVQVSYKARDKLMPKRGTLSISKAKKLIKFRSKWSLEKGYLRYIDWYKKIFLK
jgi:nucleoside-diphosphate-sugar epimerase